MSAPNLWRQFCRCFTHYVWNQLQSRTRIYLPSYCSRNYWLPMLQPGCSACIVLVSGVTEPYSYTPVVPLPAGYALLRGPYWRCEGYDPTLRRGLTIDQCEESCASPSFEGLIFTRNHRPGGTVVVAGAAATWTKSKTPLLNGPCMDLSQHHQPWSYHWWPTHHDFWRPTLHPS